MRKKYTILIVDDEYAVRCGISEYLKKNGFNVLTAANSEEALHIFNTRKLDLVVTDIRLPGESGLKLMENIKKKHPNFPLIIITGYGSVNYELTSRRGGADFLEKPFHYEELEYRIRRVLEDKEKSEWYELLKHYTLTAEHELKTPLNSAIGFLDLLNEDTLPDNERKEYIGHIDKSLATLLKKIDTLMELLALDLDDFHFSDFDFYTCMTETVHHFEQEFAQYRPDLKIILNYVTGEKMINADSMKIMRVFEELVTNAARNTENDEITVKVKHNTKVVEIQVLDKGKGIIDQDLERLYQLGHVGNFLHHKSISENPYEYRCSGPGFGLCMAKRIVELHGGRIWHESAGGNQGTLACYTIPLIYSPD